MPLFFSANRNSDPYSDLVFTALLSPDSFDCLDLGKNILSPGTSGSVRLPYLFGRSVGLFNVLSKSAPVVRG